MSSLYSKKYTTLKGVDFSADPTLISDNRAAILENIIPDGAGYPEKRAGWRTIQDYVDPIYGIWRYVKNGEESIIVHSGTKLYKHDSSPVELCADMALTRSSALQYGNELLILDGASYRIYDGTSVKKIDYNDTIANIQSEGKFSDNGVYIPTTTISGTLYTGTVSPYTPTNGVKFEDVNLLSKWRRNTFCSTLSSDNKTLILDDKAVLELGALNQDQEPLITNIIVFVNGVKKPVYKSTSTKSGVFTYSVYANEESEVKRTVLYTKNLPAPLVEGKDNIEVYYVAETDSQSNVQNCTIIGEYANRVFVTGNPNKPNFDWHSGFEKSTYFPDLSYTKFGDDTPVMGYLNTGQYMAVLKGGKTQGSSIYLRGESTLNGETVFPVKQMASGISAISKRGFCNLLNDNLFLTDNGIYAITSLDITDEKAVANRSYYVDNKLTKEPDLQSAVMVKWKNLCLCCVNSHCYILNADSSKSYNHKGDLLYECYYWTNIPATCFLTVGDELYFGTDTGKLCKFNTDIEGVLKFNDDGQAITAIWGTKNDDDGDVSRLKTMIKRGNSVTVKPYSRSSAHIKIRTDKDIGREVTFSTYSIADIFDWEDIDFSRFTFNTFDTPQEIMINSKVKDYKRMQIIVYNDGLNEGFGIFEIVKHYVIGNFIKR